MRTVARYSGHVLLEGDPEENPGNDGDTVYLSWSGNTLGFPRRSPSDWGEGSLHMHKTMNGLMDGIRERWQHTNACTTLQNLFVKRN